MLQVEEVLAKAAVKLIVERFCLACCSSSLRTGRGTLPIGAAEGLGEVQNLKKNLCLILAFYLQSKAVPPFTSLQWRKGVLCTFLQLN